MPKSRRTVPDSGQVKLVLDTKVLVSGSAWPGPAARLLDATLDGSATLCVAEPLLSELARVLHRDKFRARFAAHGLRIETVVGRFREVAHHVEPVSVAVPPALRDPDDIHVLACAWAAGADAIVTGDHDLLVLESFQGIPIIRIDEALKRLGLAD